MFYHELRGAQHGARLLSDAFRNSDAGTGSLSSATFDHATPQATDHSSLPYSGISPLSTGGIDTRLLESAG